MVPLPLDSEIFPIVMYGESSGNGTINPFRQVPSIFEETAKQVRTGYINVFAIR